MNKERPATEPADPVATDRRGGTVAFVLVAAALVTGVLLRAWDLGDQWVVGDEVHGLRAAVRESPSYILAHNTVPDYDDSDYSIPLAFYHHLVMRTIGLGEWTFRLPCLLAGMLLIPLVAAFGRRWMGRSEGALAAWLVALSPPFFLYSRFARPYMPVVCLCMLTAFAALRWRHERVRGFGFVLAVAGAAAIYLNLTAAPAVLCAFAWSGLAARRAGPRQTRCFGMAVFLGVMLTLGLLAPSLGALLDFAGNKSGSARFGVAKSWRGLHILFGTSSPAIVTLGSALVILGGVVAWRRRLAPTKLFVSILVADVAMLVLLAPGGAQHPSVMARYMITAWPGLLLFAAVGALAVAQALVGRWQRASPTAAAAATLIVAALLPVGLWLTGPLPSILAHKNAFTNHRFHYGLPEWEFDPSRAPAIYAALAAEDSDRPIVEVPWTLEWGLTIYGLYQETHQRPVQALSAFATYFRDDGVEFASMVPWQGEKPIYRGFDTIIVHKDIVAESYHVTGRNGGQWPENLGKKRWGYVNDAKITLQVCLASPQFEQVFEDEWVVILERTKP